MVYSSPYYRCLQTLVPYIQLQQDAEKSGRLSNRSVDTTKIRPESGFCEWFGAAPFDHPQPADPEDLKNLVPSYDETYTPAVKPAIKGETYAQLQDRVAAALAAVIARCDAEGKKTMVLCTHAAVVIVLGRILTGNIPDSMEKEDFRAFTCGLSVYKRDKTTARPSAGEALSGGRLGRDGLSLSLRQWHCADAVGTAGYKDVGAWQCEKNSDCSFLSGGEERGW